MTTIPILDKIKKDDVDAIYRRAFSFEVELQRCYKEPDGTMHVIGIASDDQEDRTNDRMSTKCVHSMAEQCTKNDLPLLDNHRATFGFGHTHAAFAKQRPKKNTQTGKDTGEFITELEVDFALDSRFPQSEVLFEEVLGGGTKKQLSIGGFLNTKNPRAISFEENDKGRTIRVINDLELEHIASTRPKMAAVPRTRFVEAIIKDIWGDEDTELEDLFKGLENGYATAAEAERDKERLGISCAGTHSRSVGGQTRWFPCANQEALNNAQTQARMDRSLSKDTDFTTLSEAQAESRRVGCAGRTHTKRKPDGTIVWRPCADPNELGEAMRRRGGNLGPADPSQQREAGCRCDNQEKDNTNDSPEKAVVPFARYPLVRTASWNFDSRESNLVLGDDNFAQFKAAHTQFDSSQSNVPTTKGAYKLPHHWIRNGRLVTVDRGVIAARGVLAGARGGVSIPASDRVGVQRHLDRHSREFGMIPPEDRSYTADEYCKHFEDQDVEMEWFRELIAKETQMADADSKTPKTEGQTTETSTEGGSQTATATSTLTIDPETQAEAEKAVKGLAAIGKLFKSTDNTDGDEAAHEEVKSLLDTAESVGKLPLNKQDRATIARIQSALGRLLTDAGTEGVDPEASVPGAAATKGVTSGTMDVDKLAKAVADILSEGLLKDLRTGQGELAKIFSESFTNLVKELGTGLEDMAKSFKEYIDTKVDAIEAKVSDVHKTSDERLGTLEKAAGVSQRIQGSDGGTATGQAPQQINKDSGDAPSHTPGQKPSVWKGIFGTAKKHQLARR